MKEEGLGLEVEYGDEVGVVLKELRVLKAPNSSGPGPWPRWLGTYRWALL